MACSECGYVLPPPQVIQFIDEGTGFTYCPRGGTVVAAQLRGYLTEVAGRRRPLVVFVHEAGTVVAAEADVISRRLLGTEEQKSTVLPVLLAGTSAESLPPLMRTRIYADFREPESYFTQLFELVLALHDLAPGLPGLKDLHNALRRAQDGEQDSLSSSLP